MENKYAEKINSAKMVCYLFSYNIKKIFTRYSL